MNLLQHLSISSICRRMVYNSLRYLPTNLQFQWASGIGSNYPLQNKRSKYHLVTNAVDNGPPGAISQSFKTYSKFHKRVGAGKKHHDLVVTLNWPKLLKIAPPNCSKMLRNRANRLFVFHLSLFFFYIN